VPLNKKPKNLKLGSLYCCNDATILLVLPRLDEHKGTFTFAELFLHSLLWINPINKIHHKAITAHSEQPRCHCFCWNWRWSRDVPFLNMILIIKGQTDNTEMILWDAVGCLKNDYSTPTVNNIYLSSACTVSNLGSIQPCV